MAPEIRKKDILLIKTVVEGGDIEWWFGLALDDHAEAAIVDNNADDEVRVQWMHPDFTRAEVKAFGAAVPERVPANDFNVIFTPWYCPRQDGGKGADAKVESMMRKFVVLTDVKMTQTNRLAQTSKRAIVDLDVGFSWEDPKQSKRLVYHRPRHDENVEEWEEMEDDVGVGEEDED